MTSYVKVLKVLLLSIFAVVTEYIFKGTFFIAIYLIDDVLSIFSQLQSRDIYYSQVIK